MDLQRAARQRLVELVGTGGPLRGLALQPDRAVFLAESSRIVLKVYEDGDLLAQDWRASQAARSVGVPTPELLAFWPGPPAVFAMRQVVGQPISSAYPHAAREAGALLARFHGLGAPPPFWTGELAWERHIQAWIEGELVSLGQHGALSGDAIGQARALLARICATLGDRPIVLLHGDLQSVHILVDPDRDRVAAFLDFADAEPGDPLLDIAVLTLWDEALTGPLLAGYPGLVDDEATRSLIADYRFLRHISEISWLLERGYDEYANRNIVAVRDALG